MPVTKVLIVDMGELGGGFPRHDDRYLNLPEATTNIASYRDGFFVDEAAVRHWLRDLNVVFSVETLYDPRFHLWARDAGVATVIQLNPEFIKPDLFEPTAWWAPTTWRINELGVEATYVPVPVALDRFPPPEDSAAGTDPLRVLHVVGHRAASDRNGTQIFHQAMRYLRAPIHARVITQDNRLLPFRRRPPHEVEVVMRGVEHYWQLYADADVLVLPRRYGGLSLVAQEAMAASLALVMSDCAPNGNWPALLVTTRPRGVLRAPATTLQLYETNPRALAEVIDRLSADRDQLRAQQVASRQWAEAHSWSELTPVYLRELEHATSLAQRQ